MRTVTTGRYRKHPASCSGRRKTVSLALRQDAHQQGVRRRRALDALPAQVGCAYRCRTQPTWWPRSGAVRHRPRHTGLQARWSPRVERQRGSFGGSRCSCSACPCGGRDVAQRDAPPERARQHAAASLRVPGGRARESTGDGASRQAPIGADSRLAHGPAAPEAWCAAAAASEAGDPDALATSRSMAVEPTATSARPEGPVLSTLPDVTGQFSAAPGSVDSDTSPPTQAMRPARAGGSAQALPVSSRVARAMPASCKAGRRRHPGIRRFMPGSLCWGG